MARPSSIWVSRIFSGLAWLLLGTLELRLGLAQSLRKLQLHLQKFIGLTASYPQQTPEVVDRLMGVVHLVIGADDLDVLFAIVA